MATDHNNPDAPVPAFGTAILTGYEVSWNRHEFFPEAIIHFRLDYNLDTEEHKGLSQTLLIDIPLSHAKEMHRDLSVVLAQ